MTIVNNINYDLSLFKEEIEIWFKICT